MLNLGPLAFASPWLLGALALLPLLWWMLRVTPPVPRLARFPAIRLLFDLPQTEETPARTPLWLLLLRLLIAALVIVALAGPILNPRAGQEGSGPLLVVLDDGWAAGRDWQQRLDVLGDRLNQAERAGRPVALWLTAERAGGAPPQPTGLMRASEALARAQGLAPKPWGNDRRGLAEAADALRAARIGEILWIGDGLDDGTAIAFAEGLQNIAPLTLLVPEAGREALLLRPPRASGPDLALTAFRPSEAPRPLLHLRATGEDGRLLLRQDLVFDGGARKADVVLTLPTELRNQIARFEIESEQTAGAVVLMDERWRRRPVGLVSAGSGEGQQPLLSELHYLDRALNPSAEVRRGSIAELLDRRLAVLVLADVGQVVGQDRSRIQAWIETGGVLIRFAGERMAEAADDLVPVALRSGGRALGGALSWSEPARLGAFDAESPFAGLKVPDEVLVHRQVLAEPALDLAERTWAKLTDGTPLVTAERRERGWIVLFHTTANTDWSDLALSGLFVEMLRRVVDLSQGVVGEAAAVALPPLQSLDGFGRLGDPPVTAVPLSVTEGLKAGPANPPGFYGDAVGRRALNLADALADPRVLGPLPSGVQVAAIALGREVALLPWLLALALALFLADLVIALALRGLLAPRLAAPGVAAALALLLLAGGGELRAQDRGDAFALAATLEFRLAYVVTGVNEVDEISRAGLEGLGRQLGQRTSVETSLPLAVDIERDELLFFPLLYWPVVPEQPALSPNAAAKLDRYLKAGGNVLFDTRDAALAVTHGAASRSAASARLASLLQGLDLPTLHPVPPDHVLTKSFFLMQEFPGRYTGGPVWVEQRGNSANDGVSSVVIGSNDWAGAWATSVGGRPAFAVVPGGERQREMAYRFGINLVMYSLAGNYKADQVHVPALLERLGQ
ncbi:MAG: DUF4159 domain-containing protein [Alphaproteobacteria bacterium]|nr:DUF4159 domain-containing protein [Alphaproteobacteria bacterium]